MKNKKEREYFFLLWLVRISFIVMLNLAITIPFFGLLILFNKIFILSPNFEWNYLVKYFFSINIFLFLYWFYILFIKNE